MPVIPFKLKRPVPSPLDARAIAERVNAAPEGFDINFEEITRYIEDEAANGSNSDEVVYSPKVATALRALCGQLGFSRLPLTYGELHGLLEYGHMLRYAVGRTLRDSRQRALWQEVAGKAFLNQYPRQGRALELFLKGNLRELAEFHAVEGTLEKLGRGYQQFDNG